MSGDHQVNEETVAKFVEILLKKWGTVDESKKPLIAEHLRRALAVYCQPLRFGVPEETTDLCPECGEPASGVVFCPAWYEGDFIVLGKGQKRFLCEKHFRKFLEDGEYEVILGHRRWLCKWKRKKRSAKK